MPAKHSKPRVHGFASCHCSPTPEHPLNMQLSALNTLSWFTHHAAEWCYSPLMQFLDSTSPFDLYSFNFSGTNLSLPNSEPVLGMDQYWNLSEAPLLSSTGTTPTLPNLFYQNTPHMLTTNFVQASISAYSALHTGAAAPKLLMPTSNPPLPTLAAQNTVTLTTNFIPASISGKMMLMKNIW